MRTRLQFWGVAASLLLAAWLFTGCAINYQKPDEYLVKKYDYTSPAKDRLSRQANVLFGKIARKNGELAAQLAKLPAFSRGIDQADLHALEVIQQTIRGLTFPEGFPRNRGDDALVNWLACMTEDGLLHDSKRYSPSLEVWVWAIKDGDYKVECMRDDFCGLVDLAQALSDCRQARLAMTIAAWGCMDSPRWSDFDTVTARLNRPELIDRYQAIKFSYATTGEGYGCGGVDISGSTDGCSPAYIFGAGRGNCAAYTTFAVHALRKAGYEAYPVKVYSYWPSWFAPGAMIRDYHYLTLYRTAGKWYILDNGRGGGPRGIAGPYDKPEDMPYRIMGIEREGR